MAATAADYFCNERKYTLSASMSAARSCDVFPCVWREMTVNRDDSYVTAYTDLLDVLGAGLDPAANRVVAARIDGILAAEHQRWLKFSEARLKHFGYAVDAF